MRSRVNQLSTSALAALLLTLGVVATFGTLAWGFSGQDDPECEIYCGGPSNMVVMGALVLLFPIVWIVAVVATSYAWRAKHRYLAGSCAAILTVPVVVLTAMYMATH